MIYIKQVNWEEFVVHASAVGKANVAIVERVGAVVDAGKVRMVGRPTVQASCLAPHSVRFIFDASVQDRTQAELMVQHLVQNVRDVRITDTAERDTRMTDIDSIYVSAYEGFHSGSKTAYDLFKTAAFELPSDNGNPARTAQIISTQRKLGGTVISGLLNSREIDADDITDFYARWRDAVVDKNILLWDRLHADILALTTGGERDD